MGAQQPGGVHLKVKSEAECKSHYKSFETLCKKNPNTNSVGGTMAVSQSNSITICNLELSCESSGHGYGSSSGGHPTLGGSIAKEGGIVDNDLSEEEQFEKAQLEDGLHLKVASSADCQGHFKNLKTICKTTHKGIFRGSVEMTQSNSEIICNLKISCKATSQSTGTMHGSNTEGQPKGSGSVAQYDNDLTHEEILKKSQLRDGVTFKVENSDECKSYCDIYMKMCKKNHAETGCSQSVAKSRTATACTMHLTCSHPRHSNAQEDTEMTEFANDLSAEEAFKIATQTEGAKFKVDDMSECGPYCNKYGKMCTKSQKGCKGGVTVKSGVKICTVKVTCGP